MDLLSKSTTKYDIPLDHLDYNYVEKCRDVKELEKILRVLRSGTEGRYPDLETCTENRIQMLEPKSKLLRKEEPIPSISQLPSDQQKEIFEDLNSWASEIKSLDTEASHMTNGLHDSEFPVRGSTIIATGKGDTAGEKDKKPSKRVMPRDYREWDKVDVDAELEKMDKDDEKVKVVPKSTSAAKIPDRVDSQGWSESERVMKAEKEKDKGNEAFKAGDYEEAVLYYSRSLSIMSNIAARNNRAQAYIKLEKWDKAITDTNTVIKEEPDNIKAYLRRGVAYQGKRMYIEAKDDICRVLDQEPSNKRAKNVLEELQKALDLQKTHGRRMVIEESDSEDEENDTEESQSENGVKLQNGAQLEEITVNGEQVDAKFEAKQQVGAGKWQQGNKVEETGTDKQKLREKESKVEKQNTQERFDEKENVKTEKSVSENVSEKVAENVVQNGSGEKKVKVVEQPAVEPPPPLPTDVLTLKDKGLELFKCGHYADAIDCFSKAISKIENDSRQNPNLSVLYSNRAACKSHTGDCMGCIEDCNLSLTLMPGVAKPLLRRAKAYEQLEKYRQAYVDFRQVTLIDRSIEAAQQGAARCQSYLQNLDGPKWRDKLPAMSPMATTAPFTLSPMTSSKGAVTSSKPAVTSSRPAGSSKGPSKQEIFETQKKKGNDLVQKSEFESAITCYTKCIEVCPDQIPAYTNRALCYIRTNKPDQAITDCKKALELDPRNVKALFRQGQAYKMLENYSASESSLKRVLAIDKSNAAAKRELKVVQKYQAEQKAKKSSQSRKMVIEETSSDEEEGDSLQPPGTTTKVPSASTHSTTSSQPAPHTQTSPTEKKSSTQVKSSKVTEDSIKPQKSSQSNGDIRNDSNCSKKTSQKGSNNSNSKEGIQSTVKQDVPLQTSQKNGDKLAKDDIKPISEKKDKASSGSKSSKPSSVPSAPSSGEGVNETSTGRGSGKEKLGDVIYQQKASKASSKIRPTYEAQTAGNKGGPQLSKATAYEFVSAWTSIKSAKDIDPYMTLLEQVEPAKLPSVISNKLEGDMLQIIAKCAGRLADNERAAEGYAYLKHLTKVPRFEMNTMFMSAAEKQDLRTVLKKLRAQKSDMYASSDVDQLAKTYGV